jgi:DNA-binding transcriptional regulator LsrR (DeoR family)
MRQAQITQRLNLHQSTVSRLLKRALETGIVKISIASQTGIHLELEEALEAKFHLKQAVVVDSVTSSEEQIARDLGSAAASLLDTFLPSSKNIGISSWSAALLEMINNLHPSIDGSDMKVVQILGGMGNAGAQMHATFLAQKLATLLGGTPVLLPAPGITSSAEARRIIMREKYVKDAISLFDHLDTVLVGIGTLQPSQLLQSSGNTFSKSELAGLSRAGAVGDICLQYFDIAGTPVATPLADRVVSMSLTQLRKTKHVIGVAGGSRKVDAIRGALNGRWINVLVTDRSTAKALLA